MVLRRLLGRTPVARGPLGRTSAGLGSGNSIFRATTWIPELRRGRFFAFLLAACMTASPPEIIRRITAAGLRHRKQCAKRSDALERRKDGRTARGGGPRDASARLLTHARAR